MMKSKIAQIDRYPTLAQAHEHSCRLLEQIRACLAGIPQTAPEVMVVAVSGSLGRLEAMEHSDCDLIVVLDDQVSLESDRSRAALASIWHALAPLELPRPKATGIYATPTTAAQLCDPKSLGVIAEDVDVFGKRMQLLLDTRPVYGADAYAALIQAVVDRYAWGFVDRDPTKEWTFLLNDLIRYFRSLCVWRQFDFSADRGGWYTRNIKLRHSWVILYAGLLFLLGECSKQRTDKINWLIKRLSLTPLERISLVYLANDDSNFPRIAAAHDRFLAALGDPAIRRALAEAAPADPGGLAGKAVPDYENLHTISSDLLAELVRFTIDRRGNWSQRYFEYLFF